MNRAFALLIALALALALGPAGCAGRPPADGGSDPVLNPKVAPPPSGLTVTPDLPVITPPPGMISQEEAKRIALSSRYDMPLVLSRMQFDEANSLWEVIFTTDGRFAMQPRSHMAPSYSSDDPVVQRKEERSLFNIPTEFNLAIDGRTGERRGGGFRAGPPDLKRPDLEHYRGRIIYAGEVVALRLTNGDGTWEGRTLLVDLPQSALTSGLTFWQVKYGMGRLLDVWGLTGPQGRVVAYKVALPEPPPEILLANRLILSVPAMPGAVDLPELGNPYVLKVPRTSPEEVVSWYRKEMPAYGWTEKSPEALQFQSAAGATVLLVLTPLADGTRVMISFHWGSGFS